MFAGLSPQTPVFLPTTPFKQKQTQTSRVEQLHFNAYPVRQVKSLLRQNIPIFFHVKFSFEWRRLLLKRDT